MKRLLHDDDRRLGDALVVAVLARHLDRRLGRLEAGVAEEDLVEAGDLGDAVRGRLLVGDAPEVGGVYHPALNFFHESRSQPGMRIAERVHRDARQRIEVFLAGFVPQPHAFAAHERHRLAGVRVHDVAHGAIPRMKNGG